MTEKDPTNPWLNRDPNEASMDPEAEFAEEALLEGEEPVFQEQTVIEQMQAQMEEMKSQVLRAHAEMENVRRRADQEKTNARKFAVEAVVSDLIPVLDSLDQGLQNAPANDPMVEGVKLTLKMFADVLSKYGVKVLEPMGEKFNPQLHEAMSMQPDASAPPDTVTGVLQKGYTLHDRLIRPSRVIVSKA